MSGGFWLLDGRTGWRTLIADGIAAGSAGGGLRLDADPAGPLRLTTPDLGGLVLPPELSVDEDGSTYLLVRATGRIRRHRAGGHGFTTLPEIGGPLAGPRAIVARRGLLYVAGATEVRVFHTRSRTLRHVWAGLPAALGPAGDRVLILDRDRGRVYAHRPGTDAPRPVLDAGRGGWSRVAADRTGRIHLLDEAAARLDVFAPDGRPLGAVSSAGSVAGRFDPPPVLRDHRGRITLDGVLFDDRGEPATAGDAERPGPPGHRPTGTWISEALDSAIARCAWHRVEVRLDALPPGSRVEISTATAGEPLSAGEVRALPASRWSAAGSVTGPTQPGPGAARPPDPVDALVHSDPGRLLWIRLRLDSDGYDSPVVGAVRAHYPRESYLEHLPAVFRSDEASRSFLERFLAIFQTDGDRLAERIDDLPRYFDPRAVPDEALGFLAGWLGVPIEGGWTAARNRRLLVAEPGLRTGRGTPVNLGHRLRPYLDDVAGSGAAARTGYPRIVEAFRVRDRLLLSVPGTAELGHARPLWSRSVVGRLQIGVHATLGEARIVSTGDPRLEVFQHSAHRFSVVVPACWVPTATAERRLRRAVEAAKPAHTGYELCLVEPRIRVGVQSTLGLDMILGDRPVARLACRHDTEAPPSRPPRARLGYDSVLGCTGERELRLGPAGSARPGRRARLGAGPLG